MRVIAIAGGSGSGKSSLAAQLQNHFIYQQQSSEILCEDSYYLPLSDTQRDNITSVDFDHPDAIDHSLMFQQLTLLKQASRINVPMYCYQTHSRLPETRALSPTDFLILEGLHLLHRSQLVESYDIAVFVDTPEETRLDRRMRRDINERDRTRESVLYQFEKTVKPNHDQFIGPSKHNADLVVDGTKPLEHLLDMVIKSIE